MPQNREASELCKSQVTNFIFISLVGYVSFRKNSNINCEVNESVSFSCAPLLCKITLKYYEETLTVGGMSGLVLHREIGICEAVRNLTGNRFLYDFHLQRL